MGDQSLGLLQRPVYEYDYSDARAYCKSLGMVFLEEWVPAIDAVFKELGFQQYEVDRLMREYIIRVKQLFTPSAYPFKTRILLALHFLFRK